MMNQIRQKTHLCVPTDFGVQLLFTHGFSACPNIKYEEKFHPCRAYMSNYTKNLDFSRLDLLDVEQSRWQDALYKEIKDIIIRLSVAIYTDASRHVVYVMEDANRYFA